jgi:antitoxin component of RelBE/YafQ-DinJ toxin-antitoxin module
MTPQRRTLTFRIDDELLEGLHHVWEKDGVPVSEQVRRAVQDWLERRGVKVKTAPRRAGTRRKA